MAKEHGEWFIPLTFEICPLPFEIRSEPFRTSRRPKPRFLPAVHERREQGTAVRGQKVPSSSCSRTNGEGFRRATWRLLRFLRRAIPQESANETSLRSRRSRLRLTRDSSQVLRSSSTQQPLTSPSTRSVETRVDDPTIEILSILRPPGRFPLLDAGPVAVSLKTRSFLSIHKSA